jgi:kinetochor protein Mis14/NSL1
VEEDLLREIAALKRSVPGTAASQFAEKFKTAMKADDVSIENARVAAAEQKPDKDLLEVQMLERQSSVEEGFGKAIEGLGHLKKEMPATAAKMERAIAAGEYVATER